MARNLEENRLMDPDLDWSDEDDELLSDDEILSVDTAAYAGDEDFEDEARPLADELSLMGFRSPAEYI